MLAHSKQNATLHSAMLLLSDDCNVDQRSIHWVEDAEI
jgi:hypothetical protein